MNILKKFFLFKKKPENIKAFDQTFLDQYNEIARLVKEARINQNLTIQELCKTNSWKEYLGNRDGKTTKDKEDVKNVGVGRFVGLEWKLGVAMESSNCKNLGKPFVSLVFRIATNDKTVAHHVEMDMEEFQKFHSEFKEDIFENLNPMNVVKSRNSLGGTGFDQVKEQVNEWKKKLLI